MKLNLHLRLSLMVALFCHFGVTIATSYEAFKLHLWPGTKS